MESIATLVAGLVVLAIGAEFVLRGATRVAAQLGITPMLLGLTVVAIGTSMPELAIGIIAAEKGSGGLAIGNIAGTNVFNILFILGMSALVRPLTLQLQVVRLDLPVMIAAALTMAVMAWDGVLGRLDGLILVVAGIAYTIVLVFFTRRESADTLEGFTAAYPVPVKSRRKLANRTTILNGLLLVAGIGATILGADWLVDGATDIAKSMGISDTLIGLTIVAVGTSAPELATTIVSTIKDERDVAIGNLLGSSVYNIFIILGITCLSATGGLPVEPRLLLVDIPIMAGVALLCIPVFVSGRSVSRREGAMFVALYVAYMSWLIIAR